MCVCVCARARARALHLYGVAPSPAVTTADIRSRAESIGSSPHLHAPFPTFSPSLISLMVSVDVKHHVYLLTIGRKTNGLLLLLLLILLLLRGFVADDMSYHIDIIINSNCRNAQRNCKR